MNKNLVFNLLISLFMLVGAILWLLSEAVPNVFGWFNVSFALAIAGGGAGMLFVVKGSFKKGSVSYKKANIWLGIGLLILTVFCLVWGFVMPLNFVGPIICIIVAFGFIFGILATNGQKWDIGDNQQEDYQNYFQRKQQEDKTNKEE